MEAVDSSETLGNILQITWRHTPEDRDLDDQASLNWSDNLLLKQLKT
jgi:hypothetical protein